MTKWQNGSPNIFGECETLGPETETLVKISDGSVSVVSFALYCGHSKTNICLITYVFSVL